MSPLRLYWMLAPLLYAAFALLTPPFQTPDEHQHLFRAFQLAHGQLIATRRGEVSGGAIAPGLLAATQRELGTVVPHTARVPALASWHERMTRATPIEPQKPWQFANFLGAAPYTPIGYIPQMAAIRVAEAGELSVENTLRLGRLLNAAVTFLLLATALRLMPGGKPVLLLVGLMPMTAACAASFGQDGVIIGASALLVALALRARPYGIGRAAGLATIGLTLVVTLAKYVYVPLGALAFITRRPGGRLRPSWPSVAALGLAAVLTAFWLRAVADLSVPMLPGYPLPAKQLRYILGDPAPFAVALATAYEPRSLLRLWTMLFTFGWLNVGPVLVASLCTQIALAMVWWFGGEDPQPLPPYWRAWWLLLCAATAVGLALAVYLAANPLGSRSLSGLQGRYYIPLMLPILLAVRRRSDATIAQLPLIIAGLMVTANAFCLGAIAHAYYS